MVLGSNCGIKSLLFLNWILEYIHQSVLCLFDPPVLFYAAPTIDISNCTQPNPQYNCFAGMYFDEDAEGDKVYYYLYLAIYQHEDLQQNGMWDILAISRRRIYHCLSVGWGVCKYLKFSNKTNKWKSLWKSPIEWWCWFYLTLTQPLGNTRFNGLSGIPAIACQLYYLDIKMLVETNIVLGYQNDDCKQSVNNMHHVDNIRYQAMFRDCCLIGMELNVSGSLSLSIERDCELIEGDAFSL